MKSPKIILHIDMNCFYASCEIAENPELYDKPVVVAPDDPFQRGIILSPNYEARKYGIKTTMLVKDAFKLCKDIIVIQPDMDLYSYYSQEFYNYLLKITNKVEMASIDEAYVDVSDLNVDVPELAKKIQTEILETYKLPCSIGIAPNKFLAKMGSDMKKPLGITIVRKREVDKVLWPLKIEDMQGIGKKTAPKLREIGINTIGDLATFKNIKLLESKIGEINAQSLINKAYGNDDSDVNYNSDESVFSVSNAHTFDRNIYEEEILKETLKVISNTVSDRLQNKNLKAYTIGLQLKYANFKQINRSRSLQTPTNDSYEIYKIVENILDENFESGKYTVDNKNSEYAIRLIGIFANRVIESSEPVKQISIFDDLNEVEKQAELKKILDGVKNKFGDNSIKKGYYKYIDKNSEK